MSKFLNLKTKEVLTKQDILNQHADKSFTLGEAFYKEQGLAVLFPSPLPELKKYQHFELGEPVLIGDNYHENWLVVDDKLSKAEAKVLAESLKDNLKTRVKYQRQVKEALGLTLEDGTTIDTSRESQAQINNVYSSLRNGLIETTEWKTADGWVQVDEAKMEVIATKVAEYVSFCFTAERLHNEAIDAIEVGTSGKLSNDFAELDNYDLEQYWPKNT